MFSRLKKPEFSREHRLGLVVYGGISLAIYMNGICQEFYNAVRGRGIYKLIKALTDADLVVDIISGTSAGGINGVLLSYALANSQGENQLKFEDFAKVWKTSGDIQELLFQKEYDGIEKESFFNGVGYYKSEIKQALKKCWNQKEKASEDDWFSEFGELDLFVTGTDILGRIYQVFDNTGCVIDVKDHHATFHLKYREHGENSFNPDDDDITYEALAKLCQITSCFPVAFPPVTVRLDTKDKADEKLVEWGGLKKNRLLPKPEQEPKQHKSRSSDKRVKEIDDDPGEGYRLHFVDGGVLDNRPFSYTIKEIYQRTAERPVFRKLFYVDPSPDRFQDNPRYKEMLKPGIIQVVLDSLIGMPRYESINNDLELIKEHNEKVRRYKFLLVDLEELLDKDTPDLENQDFYDQQKNVYLRTRLISLEDKILPLIFLESEDFEKASVTGDKRTKKLDKVAELLSKPFTDPQGNSQRLKLLERLEKEICDLDIDYVLRKYFFITEYVYRLLEKDYLCKWLKNKNKNKLAKIFVNEEILDELINHLSALIKDLNQHRKLIEVIKESLDKFFTSEEIERYFFRLVDEIPANNYDSLLGKQFPGKFYRAMLWLHGSFLNISLSLDSDVAKLSKDLQQNFQRLKRSESKLDEFLQKPSHEQISLLNQLASQSILKELLKETENKISNNFDIKIEYHAVLQEKLLKYFCEFEKLDTVLYPLDYLVGIPEKQLIETCRISPEDAKLGFSEKIGNDNGQMSGYKLAGDSLNAFGGFLKKSWRANDILWGRLDGLNRIVDALLTEDKIKEFPRLLKREAYKVELTPALYLSQLVDEALSLSSLQEHGEPIDLENQKFLEKYKTQLKEELEQLRQVLENENIIEYLSKEELIKKIRKSLVSVGHILILDQEFKDTIQVSIEEQLTGKKLKKSPKELETPKFEPIKGSFNSAITALAVIKLAKQSLESMSLKEKVDFFCEHYKVGSETLEDIPKSELKKLAIRFIHIFRDIIRTGRHRSLFIRSTVWNRIVFALLGFLVILALETFVKFF